MTNTATAPSSTFFTEREEADIRMAALAWLGDRGSREVLYGAFEGIVRKKLGGTSPRYVCATCQTAWTGDVRQCPTCSDE